MTEIKFEKKKTIWPWLLGIGFLAAIIYLLYTLTTLKEENTRSAELINVKENNGPVKEFVTFVNNDSNKMTLDHTYTSQALLKLSAATKAIADKINYDTNADLDKVNDYAGKITNDPIETTHADNIRRAADTLSTLIEHVQQVKYPALRAEAGELRKAAASINPDVLTLDQKNAVKSFFSKAAALLEKIN